MREFRMTNTELKLKRERMMAAFRAGKEALEQLGLPYFLAYGSALGALREGQFQPYEDDINVGIYSWDLAALQRTRGQPTAAERDRKLIGTFDKLGFEPISEMVSGDPGDGRAPAMSACPRTFLAETWNMDMAFPILYKFTHRESFVRFDILVFASQFGQLWDFADGGAETSSGWRYTPFSPQPVEFEKMMTFTMPASALEEHYGPDWHVPKVYGYIENLSRCANRCQVLRVHPFGVNLEPQQLPPAAPWEAFRLEMRQYRMRYAEALADSPHEFPPKPLDLYKIESKPVVLFQAARMCKAEGNERLKAGNARGALDKYDEGLYIVDKCHEVLLTWRLIFRQTHSEKAEANRKERGIKFADLAEPDMPREFRGDEAEERHFRITLLLNAAQAALQAEKWDDAESRACQAIEADPKNIKALYRRGLARVRLRNLDGARADFWSMLKYTNFDSKEALCQLIKLMPKEDVQRQLKKMKEQAQREHKFGAMLTDIDEDERIAVQDERYQRFIADCEQRRVDKQREIAFDDWVKQYEWRYDADERTKARAKYPEFFSHMGPAPLPVEEWEVDYLTHKEIDKIVYHRETARMAAKRIEREGVKPAPAIEPEGFESQLELDDSDKEALEEEVVKKGYNYWW